MLQNCPVPMHAGCSSTSVVDELDCSALTRAAAANSKCHGARTCSNGRDVRSAFAGPHCVVPLWLRHHATGAAFVEVEVR